MHAWSWAARGKPEVEGVGLRSIQDINLAANIKRLWICLTTNTIWPQLDEELSYQGPEFLG